MNRFWETTPLEEMTPTQWESLCDGCAKCCLIRLEDEDTGEIACTNLSCILLDTKTCQCVNYKTRREIVPECIELTPESLKQIKWLPETCAYKRISKSQPLPNWHPLITGNPQSPHIAQASVLGKVIPEDKANGKDVEYEDFIIDWMD